jgi:hypothetical protein
VLGYVFNPVSFFLDYDARGALTSVIAEVNNTYGGRRRYVLGPAQRIAGAGTRFRHVRELFVSPFLHGDASYELWFDAPLDGDRLAISMHVDTAGSRVFHAHVEARRRPLTDRALAAAAVRYQFMTLQVIGLIHLQALKLRLRGVPYRRPDSSQRPITSPTSIVSRDTVHSLEVTSVNDRRRGARRPLERERSQIDRGGGRPAEVTNVRGDAAHPLVVLHPRLVAPAGDLLCRAVARCARPGRGCRSRRRRADPLGGDSAAACAHEMTAVRMLRGEIGAGESHVAGEWSSDDLVGEIRGSWRATARGLESPLTRISRSPPRSPSPRGDTPRSGANIHAHYDLGNEFYWLPR